MSDSVNTKFWSRTSWIQIGYGIWVSLINVNIALAIGFPAVALPQLTAKDSPIKVRTSDEAWIASVTTLCAPIGCIVSAHIMDKFGRRIIMIVGVVPMCVGWICTANAKSILHIIIGRAITGVGCGIGMGAPRAYITEITLPNMRGLVGVFPNLALSIGFSVQAMLGALFTWRVLCGVCGVFSGFLCVINFFLKETPYFALLRGSEEDAAKLLKHFRSSKYDIQPEMDELLEFKSTNDIRRLGFWEQINNLFSKAACKPFCIIFTYMLFTQLAGVTILIMWMVDFLQGTKASGDPNTGNIITGAARFLSDIVSLFLMYKIGRRAQAVISSIGVGIVCLVFGSVTHARYDLDLSVFPLVSLVLYTAFASLGYYVLPLLMMCELYPLQLRGMLGGITVAFLSIMTFSVNYAFPYLRDAVGHSIVIIIFGINSFIACVFLYFYLPETRNLTLQEIEEYFNERRPTLVSQKQVIAAQLQSHQPSTVALKQSSKLKHSRIDKDHAEHSNVLQLRKKKKGDHGEAGASDESNSDKNDKTSDSEENKK